jgi:hypothetical protein
METWEHGDIDMRHRNKEKWRHGDTDKEIWKFKKSN